jgi:uncharacterized membrane protein YhaH (DUF805 family)
MTFGQSISTVLRKYAVFSGRASRPEFWWYYLAYLIGGIILNLLDSALGLRFGGSTTDFTIGGQVIPVVNQGTGVLSTIYVLLLIIPTLAVIARRLHDSDRSAWWILWCFLLTFVCGVGVIVMIVLLALRGTAGDNRYGAPATP